MGEDDDDVCTGLFHLWDVLLRGLDRVVEMNFAGEIVLVPDPTAGGRDSQDADGDLLTGDPLFHHGVGVKVGLTIVVIDDVGAQDWEVHLFLVFGEQVEPVVELMVTHDLCVVADVVEGLGHRMCLTGFGDVFLLCVVVGQRGALDRVTVVDEEYRVLTLGFLHTLDQGGGTRHAQLLPGRVGCVGEIVPVEDVTVDIGRRQKRELPRACCLFLVRRSAAQSRRRGGCRSRNDECQCQCGRGQGSQAHESPDVVVIQISYSIPKHRESEQILSEICTNCVDAISRRGCPSLSSHQGWIR